MTTLTEFGTAYRLPPRRPVSSETVTAESQTAEPTFDVKLLAHDSTRFEWQILLPVPDSGQLPYQVETDIELPSSGLLDQSPWRLFQSFTRLDGDIAASLTSRDAVSTIRQQVVALTRQLTRSREGFARHCDRVRSRSPQSIAEEAERIRAWLQSSLDSVATARERLTLRDPSETETLSRERALADEFVSIRLLELLASAQQALDGVEPGSPSLEQVAAQLIEALRAELAYRIAHDFLVADPQYPGTLEQYVERAGRLKRHFQQVLTLECETRRSVDKIQQWSTTLSALWVGMGVVAFQQLFERIHFLTPLSSGLGLVALLAGVSYAAREWLKDRSRSWLVGRVHRFHGQRVLKCRATTGAEAGDVVLEAREWCNEKMRVRPEALNPEADALRRVNVIHHLHRGRLTASESLNACGSHRILHVSRVDLGPLLSSLQDPTKPVPVIDPVSHRASFVDAPRRYHLSLRVKVRLGNREKITEATVVLDKMGIHRLQAV